METECGAGPLSRGEDWRKRLEGLVPMDIGAKMVAIIGCGSVGSFMATELVRSGICLLTIVDPDTVEWANLTRTVYGHKDIGRFKVEALSGHLHDIFPDVHVEAHAKPIQNIEGGLVPLLQQADLVISAVDHPKTTGLIDRYCYALGKPVVFVGLYKGAKGGEVVVSMPEKTPCYHCSTGGVREVADDAGVEGVARQGRDYGTNRLLAEVALGSDIHMVCSAAVKIVLSLLTQHSAPNALGKFMSCKIDESCNYVMFGMEPEYYLFPATHASAVGQYAFQSIWIKTSRNSFCEVCGTQEYRESPF